MSWLVLGQRKFDAPDDLNLVQSAIQPKQLVLLVGGVNPTWKTLVRLDHFPQDSGWKLGLSFTAKRWLQCQGGLLSPYYWGQGPEYLEDHPSGATFVKPWSQVRPCKLRGKTPATRSWKGDENEPNRLYNHLTNLGFNCFRCGLKKSTKHKNSSQKMLVIWMMLIYIQNPW